MYDVTEILLTVFLFMIFTTLVLMAVVPNFLPRLFVRLLKKDFREFGSGYESVEKQGRTENQDNKPKELLHGIFRD